MKKDFTTGVMQKVTDFEHRRVAAWLRWTLGIAGMVTAVIGAAVWIAVSRMNSLYSWDLLTVFFEDREIITDYGRDALSVFSAELPVGLVTGILSVTLIGIVWYGKTAHERRIMLARIRSLAGYGRFIFFTKNISAPVPILLAVLSVMLVFGLAVWSMSRPAGDTPPPPYVRVTPTVYDSDTGWTEGSPLPGLPIANPIILSVTSPDDGQRVEGDTVTVKGKTVPNAEVFVNEAETAALASGDFSVRISLAPGENTIIISINDAAGNFVEKELTVISEME